MYIVDNSEAPPNLVCLLHSISSVNTYVYFIFSKAGKKVKVGYSTTPYRRQKALQSACGNKLTMLGIINGDRGKEKEVHQKLKDHRLMGEWFRWNLETKIIILSILNEQEPTGKTLLSIIEKHTGQKLSYSCARSDYSSYRGNSIKVEPVSAPHRILFKKL